jgi:hypothetical protein
MPPTVGGGDTLGSNVLPFAKHKLGIPQSAGKLSMERDFTTSSLIRGGKFTSLRSRKKREEDINNELDL